MRKPTCGTPTALSFLKGVANTATATPLAFALAFSLAFAAPLALATPLALSALALHDVRKPARIALVTLAALEGVANWP